MVMQMPTKPGVRRFYASLLGALNAPVSFHLPGERLERYALGLLRAVEALIMIDELQNLLADARRCRAEFLNMLRFLGDTLRISIVWLGARQAQIAVWSGDQLENRLSRHRFPRERMTWRSRACSPAWSAHCRSANRRALRPCPS